MAMETSKCRNHPSKKKIPPKRMNKAEREKMKRDKLNGLFLALAASLEVSDKNNGKVSILIEASRMVTDIVAEIERLKEENSSLESEIGQLQRQNDAKVCEVQLDLNVGPPEVETGHVSKPHARYPTPADQWPLQVLEPRPQLGGRGIHHG